MDLASLTGVPVTRTKVLVPRRPADLLTRSRLLGLLDDVLDYRLVIIVAPAGYGKTSLLTDLAHQTQLPVCWLALDELDQDPQRFFAHLIAALAQRFPDFGPRSAVALKSMTGSGFDLDRLVRIMVNEAYEHIREHFLLVLDDYHLVTENETINRLVNQFVQKADENCHIILASRTLLTLPDLPLIVARSQAAGLGFEELAFRPEEIQALVSQNYRVNIPGEVAEELARETEGWITGLLLSAHTMWHGMADRLRLARVSGVGLYDYLAQQVLDQQPPAVRDFLLRTSFLEEFDAGLCAEVLGPGEDWQGLLNVVLRGNLFVLPLQVQDGSTWLRYHHLFRDFLQSRLARDRPEEKMSILRRLVTAYTGRREWEKAYGVCRRLGDVAATAGLVEQAGSSLVKGGRLKTLAEWIDALSPGELAARPALLSLRGVAASMQGDVERGLALQSQAEVAFRARSDKPGLARTLARRAVDYRLLGDYRASLIDADEALALTDEQANMHAILAEALRAKAMALHQTGQLNEAIRWLERSLAVADTLGDEPSAAAMHMELGLAQMNAGRYAAALEHYGHALEFWRQTDNIIWQANLLNNLGVLYYLKGDYEHAAVHLEEALVRAGESGYTRMEAFVLCGLGDLYAELEAQEAAREAYVQARQAAEQVEERFLLLYLDLVQAALARADGETAMARELLAVAGGLAHESGSGYEQGLWHLEAGRLALAEGDAAQAVAHLDQAAHRFDAGGQANEGACAHLYLAAGQHSQGDAGAALAHLERAFSLAAELEGQHTLLIAGRANKPLLKAFRRDPALGPDVTRLLGRVGQFERDIPALRRRLRHHATTVALGPPRLAICALGQVDVALDGQPVQDPEWRSRKTVRELFFLLLAHPEGLAKEAVGEAMWPDSSPDQLKLRFKNGIYRLRRALGQEVVLFDEGLYRFNRALDYEYDVEAFLGKLQEAEAADEITVQLAAYREAARLYKGPYLPDAEGPWVWPERERLWRGYTEALLKVAWIHLEAREPQAALACCRRLLAQDPCLEDAHRLAMRAHAAVGNRGAVTRQFERCRRALLEEANAHPSPQTEALYQTLIR